METTFRQDFVRGIRIGTGILATFAVGWAGVSFAAAAWGALPTVSSGSTLSAGAWNDVVGQLNAITWIMWVTSGQVGIGTSPGIPWWTPGAWHRMFEISGLGADNVWSNGVLLLTNNRPTATAGDQGGAIIFSPKNDPGGIHAAISSNIRGVGGANGFWGELSFSTKADNVAGNVNRMVITSSGSVGMGINTPQSTLHVVGNYVQIPNSSWTAPAASDCDQASEAGRMIIHTPNTGAPATSYIYICPQGGGWVVK